VVHGATNHHRRLVATPPLHRYFTHAGPAPRTSSFPPDLLVMFSAGWLSFYAVLAAGVRFMIDDGAGTVESQI